MKGRLGVAFMALGAALVTAALCLLLSNRQEAAQADSAAQAALEQVVEVVREGKRDAPSAGSEPVTTYNPYDPAMTEVEIDGYLYVGYLSIPAIELELPVMSSWSYAQLKIAPCRYGGSTKTDNLVVCAHNYDRHFGRLKNLTIGDEVYFTDMDGVTSAYTVVSIETLQPTAVEEMTNGGFDLTLFTCTYGGATRVTVRCSSANAGS